MMIDLNEEELLILERALSDRDYDIRQSIKVFDSSEEDQFTETLNDLKAKHKENEMLRNKILQAIYEVKK